MSGERDRELVAHHRCDAACARPVRCIICHRLKRPVGSVVPTALTGMRCDERCAGYVLDPRPGHLWPTFVPHHVAAPVEFLAWALHQAHPPSRRPRTERMPVTYRLACLLVGGDAADVVSRLLRAGCSVRELCHALDSVVLEVSGDPISIIEVIDAWDGAGSIEIVPPPP